MTNISTRSTRKLYRLWSVPLLLGGLVWLAKGVGGNELDQLLMGSGMLLMGAYAFRHDLLDLSPQALDPSHTGKISVALLVSGILLVLAALGVKLGT